MKKNLRKFFAVLLVIAMLASQMAVSVFAVDPATYYCSDCGEHGVLGDLQHTFEATCKPGYLIYECDNVDTTDPENPVVCPGTIIVEIPADDPHTPKGTPTAKKPASCTETGIISYDTCAVCKTNVDAQGNELKDADLVIPKVRHNFVLVEEPADCLEDGFLDYYKCTECGQTFDDAADETDPDAEAVDPTVETAHGHDFSINRPEKDSTCREKGNYEYNECSVCHVLDTEDGEIPLKELADHGLGLKDHDDEDCTTDGYNVFGCNEPKCPYYWSDEDADEDDGEADGIKEILTKKGHTFEAQRANAATCYAPGNVAHVKCTTCGKLFEETAGKYEDPANAKEAADFATEQLVHTQVLVEFTPATCTTAGLTSAIVCDREGCDFIHYAAQTIEPLGHEFGELVEEVTPTACNGAGKYAHKVCLVCEGVFKVDAEEDETEEFDINYTAEDHAYETIVIPQDCTNPGTNVYTCTNVHNGVRCGHTYSTTRDPLGHDYQPVDAVAPNCTEDGVKAHYECAREDCGDLFFLVEGEYVATDAAGIVDPATGHDPIDVEYKKPTYNEPGNEAGTKCSVCGLGLDGAEEIPELKETVKFYFDVVGVNGSEYLVNTGYVQVKIFFEVIAGDNDDPAYESVVLANIDAIELGFDYNAAVFELVDVAHSGEFKMHSATPNDIANDPLLNNGYVVITQDMGKFESAPFAEGAYEVATLTFLVEDYVDANQFGNQVFEIIKPYAVHKDDDTTANPYVPSIVVSSESELVATVELMRLGDANGDGFIKANDVSAVRDFVWDIVDSEYESIYDMDKDGDVDYDDVDLLRDAVVGNDRYVDEDVNPAAPVVPAPEVA